MEFIGLLFYKLFLVFYRLGIQLAARRNKKAALWLEGRRNIFKHILSKLKPGERRVWVHCASLGEFEQGRPLIELLKQNYPDFKIVLTFFSPSGYEARKNYSEADYVFYLPMDSRQNSRKFIALVKPALVIFVKYEFWYYYFRAIEKNGIPFIMVSALFRSSQPFFKWYGALFRKMLFSVSHFFVQDNASQELLRRLDFGNVDVTGDTRIDRVLQIAGGVQKISEIDIFLNGKKALIAGSTYLEEAQLLMKGLNGGFISEKLIIAPHHVDANAINSLLQLFGEQAVLYTGFKKEDATKKVLIIDTIGLLSSVYQYGSLAMVGGGFGKGIHNILEPAAYGIPVIFGPHYHKFREAHQLLASGAAFSFSSEAGLKKLLERLNEPDELKRTGEAAKAYLQMNAGGTEKIFQWLEGKGRFQ